MIRSRRAVANALPRAARARPSKPAVHSEPSETPAQRGILSLQHLVGNHAVAAAIEGLSPHGVVQRFDTGEHAQMGSDKPIMVNGVSFTRKQLTAMGDLYKSYDQMAEADPKELKQLKKDIEAQTKYYRHEPGGHDIPEDKDGWDEHTGKRYLDLAAKNEAHFAPGQLTQGNDHKTSWEQYHKRALHVTRAAVARAGPSSVSVPEQAQGINAFGNHFLTDAFSAGHLIPKADVMHQAKQSFDSLEHTEAWWQPVFYRNDFTDRVAEIVMSDPRAEAFEPYRLKLIAYRDVSAHRLSELLFQFANRESEIFYSNIVKSIHDKLNRATAKKGSGAIPPVEVENERGQRWLLPGDTTLSASPQTLEIINLALAQAEANLDEAAATPPPPPGLFVLDPFEARIPERLNRVWSYTPHPTGATQGNIDKLRAQATDTATETAAQAFATVVLDHLDDVIRGLVKKGVLRGKADLHKAAQEMQASGAMGW